MSRYPEAQTCSSPHRLAPLPPDDGSEVQPMRDSCVTLAGPPRSCRPNLGGNVTGTSSPETHGCSHIKKEAQGRKSLLTSSSPSKTFHTWLTATRVNRVRKARFTLPFTDPFTLRATLSLTEHIGCARHDDEFGRGQNTELGGSDPTFDGFQPPKVLWGRSRPSRRKGDRVLAACRSRRVQVVRQDVRQNQLGVEEQQHGNHQGTTQTTKVGDGSGPRRRVRKRKSRSVCEVHRLHSVIRRHGGAESSL